MIHHQAVAGAEADIGEVIFALLLVESGGERFGFASFDALPRHWFAVELLQTIFVCAIGSELVVAVNHFGGIYTKGNLRKIVASGSLGGVAVGGSLAKGIFVELG